MKTKITLGILLTALISSAAVSAELDPAYLKNFSPGIILVSSKGFPAKDKFDMALFNYSEGLFNIIASDNTELNFRLLLKDSKTFGFYVDKVRKANQKKARTRTSDFCRVYFFASHTDGSEAAKSWPKSLADKPDWEPMFYIENTISNESAQWTTSAISWQEIMSNTEALKDWLNDARKGYKLYLYAVAGFVRESPEDQYWDESAFKYVVPIEYVESEPIAAGTIFITESTNPLLKWNYKVTAMPGEMDGRALGYATIYKNTDERKKVKFTLKPQGSTNTYSLMIMDIEEGTGFFGGFDVVSSTVEGAIDNAMYQLIERSLQIGDLQD